MQHAVLRLLAASVTTLLVSVAHTAPVANLPLTCSTASASQPQTDCTGAWTYQLPSSDQLIVLKSAGSVFTWNRAANLASNDLISVCSMAVEPGQYSACKDASGVRRITYVPKSQVFTSAPPPPPPPPSGAQILDLTNTPVQISQPGVYVLNRDWTLERDRADAGPIVITADNVTLDLQGFKLTLDPLSFQAVGISSTGRNVIIRNGRVSASRGRPIAVTGRNTLIQNMWVRLKADGSAIDLAGYASVLANSMAIIGEENPVHEPFPTPTGLGVRAGDFTIVRDSRIESFNQAVVMSANVTFTDNVIAECRFDTCITVTGDNNIFSRNQIVNPVGRTGLDVVGNYNTVLENVIMCGHNVAMIIRGMGNTIRGNVAPLCEGERVTGIEFQRDGNFYGDNTMFAPVPFNTGSTVQTDLGGNFGR